MDYLRRTILVAVAGTSGGFAADNIADRDWFLGGFFTVLAIAALMSFWSILTYEEE